MAIETLVTFNRHVVTSSAIGNVGRRENLHMILIQDMLILDISGEINSSVTELLPFPCNQSMVKSYFPFDVINHSGKELFPFRCN